MLKHGISENQSQAYAQQLTSGVNQLLGTCIWVVTWQLMLQHQNIPYILWKYNSKLLPCSAAGFTRRLISGKEVILSVQAALVLYGIAKVGNYFTTLGLAYTGTLANMHCCEWPCLPYWEPMCRVCIHS